MRGRRRQPWGKPKQAGINWPLPIAAFFAASAATYVATNDLPAVSMPAIFNPACDIKGNISIDSGERIYHVPGQEFYSDTRIRLEYGERWFCSEAEARAAGWRKAYR